MKRIFLIICIIFSSIYSQAGYNIEFRCDCHYEFDRFTVLKSTDMNLYISYKWYEYQIIEETDKQCKKSCGGFGSAYTSIPTEAIEGYQSPPYVPPTVEKINCCGKWNCNQTLWDPIHGHWNGGYFETQMCATKGADALSKCASQAPGVTAASFLGSASQCN